MIPRQVRYATLLAFVLNGLLVLTGQFTHSFDAFTHIFFADHYRADWWTLWEPRWYTGFSIVSYPPLVHQLMALLSHLTGLEIAFAVILWAALTAYPVAMYAFSRVFFGRGVSRYAAWGATMSPALLLAAHVFGQIPTVVATMVALFALAALASFLRKGGALNCALSVALFTVVMAAHHATLMFLPFVVVGLLIHMLLNEKVDRKKLFIRLAIFAPLALFFGLAVIWPFWAWGRGQTIQTPIDHPTRHNYLTDWFAFTAFFLPAYGPLLVIIPFALWAAFKRKYTGLSLAFLPLFILGLGGTTPLPRLLFGAGWEWLIYDRFALWASLLLLPFLGVALILTHRRLPRYWPYRLRLRFLKIELIRRNFDSWPPIQLGIPRRMATIFVFSVMCIAALTIGFLPSWMPFEPARIDMQPIVDFLARKDHAEWRYITLGFGDQLAWLSTMTNATTIDGNYHTARNLPELRSSGIGQIDTAYWMLHGLRAVDPIIKKSGEHGVRWAFVSLRQYIPILVRNGWVKRAKLINGIQIWENPAATLPPPVQIPPEDPLASFSWGVFPLLSLAIAVVLSFIYLRLRQK